MIGIVVMLMTYGDEAVIAIAPRIFVGIWHNMACAKLGTSGPRNYQHIRKSRRMPVTKVAQKGEENGHSVAKHRNVGGKASLTEENYISFKS